DQHQTHVLWKRQEQKDKAKERIEKEKEQKEINGMENIVELVESEDCESEDYDSGDDDFIVEEKSVREKINLNFYALECDRVQVSNAVAARLFTAALICLGIVDSTSAEHVVDESRIARAREKVRSKVTAKIFEKCRKLKALYFDS